MTQKAIPHLERVHGHLIFTTSIAGTMPFENMIEYCMSKAALKMMAKIIAKEEGNKYVLTKVC